MLNHVAAYAGDPILSLMEQFMADERSEKVNLSIGLYYDEDGKIPTLPSVAQSQQQLAEQENQPCIYLPMEGLAPYRAAVQALVFGEKHPALEEKRVATIQSLGGSGALMIGADFLNHYFPNSKVWVSNPTWENHNAIFAGAGFEVGAYPYFNPETKMLDLMAWSQRYKSYQKRVSFCFILVVITRRALTLPLTSGTKSLKWLKRRN